MSSRQHSLVKQALRDRAEFVTLLERLTDSGRAEWVTSRRNLGTVLCRVDDLVFEFEAVDGGSESVDPQGEVEGISCRTATAWWLWLTPLDEGQRVLALVRRARINERLFQRWRADGVAQTLRQLRSEADRSERPSTRN